MGDRTWSEWMGVLKDNLNVVSYIETTSSLLTSINTIPLMLLISVTAVTLMFLTARFIRTVGYVRLWALWKSFGIPAFVKEVRDRAVAAAALLQDHRDVAKALLGRAAGKVLDFDTRADADSWAEDIGMAELAAAPEIAKSRAFRDLAAAGGEKARAVAAAAELRYIAVFLLPHVAKMERERAPPKGLDGYMAYHILPTFKAFVSLAHTYWASADRVNGIDFARKKVRRLKQLADYYMDVGNYDLSATEAFSLGGVADPFSAIGDFMDKIGDLLDGVIKFFKWIVDIVKLLAPTTVLMVELLIELLVDFGKFLKKATVGIAKALKLLGNDHVDGVTKCTVLFGVAVAIRVRLTVTFLSPILLTAVSLVGAFMLPVVQIAILTVLTAAAVLLKLVFGTLDYFSDGALHFMMRADNHPEWWWRHAAVDKGNAYHRYVLGTFVPCAAGYEPVNGGTFCARRTDHLPYTCPGAILMRKYVTGRMWTAESLLNAATGECSLVDGTGARVKQMNAGCAKNTPAGARDMVATLTAIQPFLNPAVRQAQLLARCHVHVES